MDTNRRGFRFTLNATAEFAHEGSPTETVVAVATELSRFGCYIQTPAPFPVDTLVFVKIFQSAEYFEADGTVIYTKAASGMGVAFRETKPHFQNVLQKWILAELRNQISR